MTTPQTLGGALLALLALAVPAAAQEGPTPVQEGPAAARRGATAAQEGAPPPPAAQGAPAAPGAAAIPQDRLEQLVAPIALYPDGVLAQVLMASTYPIEIVLAARWLEAHPGLSPEKLEAALQSETWDPSVKSICAFPEVLQLMNENLDWTQDLGDAFLADQAKVMDAVQTMRRKAHDSGNLETTEQQKVTEREDQIIVVEPAQPEVVYVPTYYPSAVYGAWAPPSWYYPPMYAPPPAGGLFLGFTAGVVWGTAIWGDCHWGWGHTEVDIDIDRYNTFVDRTEVEHRRSEVRSKAQGGEWRHDPQHRKGVAYSDARVAERFGGGAGQTRIPRDQARGFGDRSSSRPVPTDRLGGRPSTGNRPAPSDRLGGRPSTGDRAAPSDRLGGRPSTSDRSSARGGGSRTSGQRSGSFSGSRSPGLDRAGSSRGSSSRGSRAGSRGSRGGGRMGGRGGGRRR